MPPHCVMKYNFKEVTNLLGFFGGKTNHMVTHCDLLGCFQSLEKIAFLMLRFQNNRLWAEI